MDDDLWLDDRVAKIIAIATSMPESSAAPLIKAGIVQAIERECEQCAMDAAAAIRRRNIKSR